MSEGEGVIRVWLLSRLYHPNFSGAAIQGHRVLSRLAIREFQTTVLAAADHLARDMKGRAVTLDGLEVRYLPVVRRRQHSQAGVRPLRATARHLNGLASNLSYSLQSAWILWRQGHRGDIVQLYSCNEFSFLVTTLARARGMHPVMRMTLIGFDDPASIAQHAGKWQRALKLGAFRQAEVMVGCSTAQTDSARSAGFDGPSVVRIPGGVDLAQYHPVDVAERKRLCKMLGLNDQKRYIVFVGSAIHRKGIDVLIQAFVSVAQQLDDVDLLIVGPCDFGDQRRHAPTHQDLITQLRQELTEMGSALRVHWTGRVDNVHQYLQVSSIFCLPTRQEGFGHVTAEAMAVGLPVVVARLEGVTTDLVQTEEMGVLIAGHQPADYAQALLCLLRDPAGATRMGDAARGRAVAEYDLEVAAQRYARLYHRLAGVTDS
ncbi:glycosyltransferase family 4 protein [Chloroflexota bacterium]